MRLLFVTWDGPATSYHETLFIPLLQRALRPDDDVVLMQFTWDAKARTARLNALAADVGMGFLPLEVPRRTGLVRLPRVFVQGLWAILRQVRSGAIDTVMARSMLPGGLTVMAHILASGRFTFVYDADGLSADERTEFGGWRPGGMRYRLFRWLETIAVRRADAVITRTERAVEILCNRTGEEPGKFVVVVNGKDADSYTPSEPAAREATRRQLGIPAAAPVIIYAGSIGPQYCPRVMLETQRHCLARDAETRFLMLTPERNHAQLHAMALGIPADRLIIREADPTEVPSLLAIADLGLAFREPTLSQQAIAPIKVAEYLLCGVPVAYTSGIGDLDTQLNDKIAVGVGGTSTEEAGRVAEWFLNDAIPNREERRREARALGLERFSLDRGATGYQMAFDLAKGGR